MLSYQTNQKPALKSKTLDKSASSKAFDINASLTAEEKLDLYTTMVRIRRFEERSIRSYQQGHIGGFCHTYIGEEAVALGSISVLGPDDQVITAYRDHAHAMAVGMGMNELMAELYGKITGCSKGKGGSMHFFDPKRNFWGGHGIVGGQTPLGAGLAFALKYQGKKAACLCYLGDGAVNQGVFYESLNLASLWDIPVIFIIENNRYSMGTSQARSSAGNPLAKRAEGFAIDWCEVHEGNDIYAVRQATYEALQRAYKHSRPTVMEIHTYRYRGHSMSDPDQTYRTKDEIKDYQAHHDPISLFEKRLLDEGVLDEAIIKGIDKAAREEAESSAKFAEESDFPTSDEIQKDVLWEEDNPDQKISKGVMFFNKVNPANL